MWDLKLFGIYILCSQEKTMFFQYEIKNFLKHSFKFYYLQYIQSIFI